MRTFSSYGPIDTDLHYYAPRKGLIESVLEQLAGGNPESGGHYITVWAPRQTGKTWIMQQATKEIGKQGNFDFGIITMQSAKNEETAEGVLEVFTTRLGEWFGKDFEQISDFKNLHRLFSPRYFQRPVILVVDEFDAIAEVFINQFANEFRDMYIRRQNEFDKPSGEKSCLLHGLALIGVRSVLGIENAVGSPFNVQRSLHVPNLTFEETAGMFGWYERESGQAVDPCVVERLFYETRGQPGLTCWFGELLTEKYNDDKESPIDRARFEEVFLAALYLLPNNNILNIISKAKREPYRDIVLKLFKTDKKIEFRYDNAQLNFLYMNGVTDIEKAPESFYVRFSSPFAQKRLFGYFSDEIFDETGVLKEPFEDLSDTYTPEGLNIPNLMRRFEAYLNKNREWLLSDAPRRKDLRIYEAVFHFCLYRYLCDFLNRKYAKVWPEFPTGNGKADLIVVYEGKTYAIELKSFTDRRGYDDALIQAARYAKQLGLSEIVLVFFVEFIDEANRGKYEKTYTDPETGVSTKPVFVATGN